MEKAALVIKRDQARKDMRSEFDKKYPPPSDREKQAALTDRMRLIKTMDMARDMIETKYAPLGA